MKATLVYKGGTESGHHGHAGRPGKRGGSAPGKGAGIGSGGEDVARSMHAELMRQERAEAAGKKYETSYDRERAAHYEEIRRRYDELAALPRTELESRYREATKHFKIGDISKYTVDELVGELIDQEYDSNDVENAFESNLNFVNR